MRVFLIILSLFKFECIGFDDTKTLKKDFKDLQKQYTTISKEVVAPPAGSRWLHKCRLEAY